MKIDTILTDIEGTTSSISFVKEVLFPYAAANIEQFVQNNSDNADVEKALKSAAEIAGLSYSRLKTEDIVAALQQWIKEDKKATPLKTLQGLLWAAGYENGDYQAHVYSDAYENLTGWKAQGLNLYVYSSGSIRAQQLFFQYSCFGDIRPLFSGFFDTTSGAKQEQESYLTIAKAMNKSPGSILFLSDIEAELDAARAAGMLVKHIVREADGTLPSERYASHSNFDAVSIP